MLRDEMANEEQTLSLTRSEWEKKRKKKKLILIHTAVTVLG